MLLDRIDIDAHGPLHHVELGPFAEHLNVILGPQGSGKTAITRFIRDSLVDRVYPQGMLSASSGRVVWADRNGLVHCRREQDGTVTGRCSVEFESRGETVREVHGNPHSWFGDLRSSTASSRAVEALQLPESIVDGVITDTTITSIARVVSAAVRAGLDSAKTFQSLPLNDHSAYLARDAHSPLDPIGDGVDQRDYDRSRRLRQQLAEIEAELSRISDVDYTPPQPARSYRAQESAWNDRLIRLHDRARQLRAQQAELRRWLAEIDRELRSGSDPAINFESPRYQHRAGLTDETLRRQLDDLDAQMIRWRRALSEVRGLRSAILSGDYQQIGSLPLSVDDEQMLHRMRFDGFMHAVDRYDRSNSGHDFYPDSYRPLHQIDDIDYRIESATRQIDWLLDRYADQSSQPYDWYRPARDAVGYARSASLGESLRHIRQDLHQLRRQTLTGLHPAPRTTASKLDELAQSERWLVASIEQLNGHRESLLRDAARDQDSETKIWAPSGRYDSYVLLRDRRESEHQLDRVNAELDRCLRDAAQVRRNMRSLPIINAHWYDDQVGDSLDARGLNDQTRSPRHRIDALRRRRAQILEQLHVVHRPMAGRSPLSDAASHWLIRLTGGRLRQVAWRTSEFQRDSRSHHSASYERTGVTIDGCDEHLCSAADRALGVLAVRMAAGDLLARTGRHVPLVLETNGQWSDPTGDPRYRSEASVENGLDGQLEYFDNGDLTRSNSPFASALRDYSRAGRQVILLTSDRSLSNELSRVGARVYQLHARPLVHAHRPLWKPHYEAEQYVGPHPHTYGHRDADDVLDPVAHRMDRYARPSRPQRGTALGRTGDVNRDLDLAWHESQLAGAEGSSVAEPWHGPYVDHGPAFVASSERTDWPRDGRPMRDGYYVAPSFTTNEPAATGRWNRPSEVEVVGHAPCCQHKPAKTIAPPTSPFFLTVDSPIDQAPSVDAVAASRMRGLKVTHINHLLQQDSNRLADALGLASVDASTIRRWQAECRLVCRVPHLRGFDARVLVGCGVTTPAQLAAIHPVDLLQQVEAFLASDRGQQILLSGSSHELSRITSWIAAANSTDEENFVRFGNRRGHQRSSDSRRSRTTDRSRSRQTGQRSPARNTEIGFDSDRYEYESGSRPNRRRSSRGTNGRRILRSSRNASRTTADRTSADRTTADRTTSGNATEVRSSRRSAKRRRASHNGASTTNSKRGSRSSNRPTRESRDFVRYDRSNHEHESFAQELKFYLQRESPVADGPSIGNRMAERLSAVGIETVNDLLEADPATVAAELDHRRVDADTVLQWQQQATLVCRVPMLRGHDAQLLVAADVTTPEELAECDAEELFAVIDPIARSNEGKRIIRGGKLPDLAEVTEWIQCGNLHRELLAA